MTGDKQYSGIASFPSISGEVNVHVGSEGLSLQSTHNQVVLDYSQLRRFELRGFRFLFETADGQAELTQMGRDTDGFYEELWRAYAERTSKALFVEDPPVMEAEGEYSYSDDGGTAKGEARIRLHPTCVVILPRDEGARRIPLCFVSELSISGYTIHIKLDTNETYELIRLGRDTIPLYDQLVEHKRTVQQKWIHAHQELADDFETRIGDSRDRFLVLQKLTGKDQVISGLFSPENEAFWMAAFHHNRVAVEFVCEEKTATYIYELRGTTPDFTLRLRHAMEAMGLHREILYLEDNELRENALYRMALRRNSHLRFLRDCMSVRVIHTESWEKKIIEAFH